MDIKGIDAPPPQQDFEKFYPKISMEEYVDNIYSVTTWDKAIKRKFLEEKKIYHLNKKSPNEDGVWNYQLFSVCPNIYYTNKNFYNYRIRKNSIMDKLLKNKKSSLLSTNYVIKDINDLKDKNWKFYSEKTKEKYLSGFIFNCIFKYGYKTTQKKLIEKIDKKLYKKLWDDAAKKSRRMSLLIKFKLKWLSPLLSKILTKKSR